MSGVTNQHEYLSQIPLCERDRLVRHGLDPRDICDTILCWGFCAAVHSSDSSTLKRSETHVSKPSMVAPGPLDLGRSFSSISLSEIASTPPYFAMTTASAVIIAFSMYLISACTSGSF